MRSPHRCAEPDSTSISISAMHRSSVRSIDELITVHLIVIGSLARGMCRLVARKYLRAHLRQNYPARKRSLPFRQWHRFNESTKQAPPQLRGMVGCCASHAGAGTDLQSALRNAAAQHRQGILLPSLNAGRCRRWSAYRLCRVSISQATPGAHGPGEVGRRPLPMLIAVAVQQRRSNMTDSVDGGVAASPARCWIAKSVDDAARQCSVPSPSTRSERLP